MQEEVKRKIDLVKNRLIHFDDLAPNQKNFQGISQEAAEKKGFFARDFGMGQWDWPQGVAIYGLHNSGSDSDKYIVDWAFAEIEKGLPTKNVNTVCPMLTLIDYPQFDELTKEWMLWIEDEFPRTDEEGLQHITSGIDKFTIKENRQQIWADTLFMTILFMTKMGVKYHRQEWIDAATYQVLLHSKYLLDRESSLFYHGWNFENQSNYGGNFWCRGNSWLTMGLPLFLTYVEGAIPNCLTDYLKIIYNNQVKELLSLRAPDYLWHTILNNPESYTETSGSAGITAGILMGINQNFNNQKISDIFLKESVTALLNQIDETGVVHGVSAGTAISEEQADYLGIIKTPMVYGQAMVLIALEEYLIYCQKGE